MNRGHHGVLLGRTADEDQVVYLKDTWNKEGEEDEHLVYKALTEAGVSNILKCYGGGYVLDSSGSKQVTLTNKYAPPDTIHARYHYRIVLEPAIPIVEFRNPYELVSALRDVAIGSFTTFLSFVILNTTPSTPGSL